ncbi:hypothetical protein D3C71_1637870 [compost metagenome]
MHRHAARQARHRRPQRIVGRGQQQFVAIVEQRVGRHRDQVGRAVAQIDVVQRHALRALRLGVVHDRLARGEDALAVRIPRRIGQVANHVQLDFFRGIEAERGQIADIELDELLAFVLHLPGPIHDGATDVIQDVREFARFFYGLHGRFPVKCAPRKVGRLINQVINHRMAANDSRQTPTAAEGH